MKYISLVVDVETNDDNELKLVCPKCGFEFWYKMKLDLNETVECSKCGFSSSLVDYFPKSVIDKINAEALKDYEKKVDAEVKKMNRMFK